MGHINEGWYNCLGTMPRQSDGRPARGVRGAANKDGATVWGRCPVSLLPEPSAPIGAPRGAYGAQQLR